MRVFNVHVMARIDDTTRMHRTIEHRRRTVDNGERKEFGPNKMETENADERVATRTQFEC